MSLIMGKNLRYRHKMVELIIKPGWYVRNSRKPSRAWDLEGCVLARAARTKYHRLAILNSRNLFLTVLETGKSKIRVPTDSGPHEGPLPDL